MSEHIGATVTAPNDANRANGHNNRALSGVPPPMFNGDRDKSETFLDKFTSYELVNGDSRQFTTPFLKVALCLSYFNGPKVDAWARHQWSWLKDQRDVYGVSITSPQLWIDFETAFKNVFTDQDTKLAAYQQLHSLKMQGSDIDSYIADFDCLTSEVGYNTTDIGVVMMFREGLQPSLLQEILLHNVPAPTQLSQWKTKAREWQTVYKELRNVGLHRPSTGGPTDLQKKWASRLGLKSYQTPTQRAANPTPRYVPPQSNGQVVPMDVDAGATERPPPYQGRGQRNGLESPRGAALGRFTKLTEAERADLVAKKACFRCRQPGHMSRDCAGHQQTNPIPENARAGGSTPSATPKMSESDKRTRYNELGGLEGIYNLVKDGPEEDKEKFMDMVQDF